MGAQMKSEKGLGSMSRIGIKGIRPAFAEATSPLHPSLRLHIASNSILDANGLRTGRSEVFPTCLPVSGPVQES
jgi:hypothetical protein